MDEYQAIMTRKLGLLKYNKQLISKLLNNMAVDKVDYTNFFRLLSNVKADPNMPEDELVVPLKAVLLDIGKERKEAWIGWLQTYVQEVLYIHAWAKFIAQNIFDWIALSALQFLPDCLPSFDYRWKYSLLSFHCMLDILLFLCMHASTLDGSVEIVSSSLSRPLIFLCEG